MRANISNNKYKKVNLTLIIKYLSKIREIKK
jgi:hypothetical protein